MAKSLMIDAPKWMLSAMNNLWELERKLSATDQIDVARRNIDRIKESFLQVPMFYEDPMGQSFKETRTDLDASISGTSTEDLVVVDVIKPIIRVGPPELSVIVQKGIVVVEAKRGEE